MALTQKPERVLSFIVYQYAQMYETAQRLKKCLTRN